MHSDDLNETIIVRDHLTETGCSKFQKGRSNAALER